MTMKKLFPFLLLLLAVSLNAQDGAYFPSNVFLINLPTNASPVAFLTVDGGGKVYETATPAGGGGVTTSGLYQQPFAFAPIQGTITSNLQYQAYPVLVVAPDTNLIYMFFSAASDISFATNAVVMMAYSANGGATWSTNVTVYTNTAYEVANFAAGVSSSGRLYEMNDMKRYGGAYSNATVNASDNHGLTWYQISSITNPGPLSVAPLPFGRIVEQDGFLIASVYTTDAATNGAVFCVRSSNSGTNWTASLMSSNNFYPPNETYILPFGRGVLYAASRLEAPTTFGRFHFSMSTNNGATWFSCGYGLNQVLSTTGNPADMVLDEDGNIVLVTYDRQNAKTFLFTLPVELSQNATNWNAAFTNAITGSLGSSGGYPSISHGGGNRLLVAYYSSASAVVGVLAATNINHGKTFYLPVIGGMKLTTPGANLQVGGQAAHASPGQIYIADVKASGAARPQLILNSPGNYVGVGPNSVSGGAQTRIGAISNTNSDWAGTPPSYSLRIAGDAVVDSTMSVTGNVYAAANVGIGTTIPSSSLDVTGQVRSASAMFTNRFGFGNAAAAMAFTKTNGHAKVTDGAGALTGGTNALWFQGANNFTPSTNAISNQQSGKVNITIGHTFYYVTNNLVTTNSILLATLNSTPDSERLVAAVPLDGVFRLELSAPWSTSAGGNISWFIVSP